MLVRVLALVSTQPCRVRFANEAGEAEGLWHGDAPPAAGDDVPVELDVDAVLSWADAGTLVAAEPGVARLRCVVQSVEDVVVARLGSGLTQLELAGDQRRPEVGAALLLRDVPLSLWPVSY